MQYAPWILILATLLVGCGDVQNSLDNEIFDIEDPNILEVIWPDSIHAIASEIGGNEAHGIRELTRFKPNSKCTLEPFKDGIYTYQTSAFKKNFPHLYGNTIKYFKSLGLPMKPYKSGVKAFVAFHSDRTTNGGVAMCYKKGNQTYAVIYLGAVLKSKPALTQLKYVAHEFLHSIGHSHEQTRKDRDKFIRAVGPVEMYWQNNNDLQGSADCARFDEASLMFNFRSWWQFKSGAAIGYGAEAKSNGPQILSWGDMRSLRRSFELPGHQALRCAPMPNPKREHIKITKTPGKAEHVIVLKRPPIGQATKFDGFYVANWSYRPTSCTTENFERERGRKILFKKEDGTYLNSYTIKVDTSKMTPGGTVYYSFCAFRDDTPWRPAPIVVGHRI